MLTEKKYVVAPWLTVYSTRSNPIGAERLARSKVILPGDGVSKWTKIPLDCGAGGTEFGSLGLATSIGIPGLGCPITQVPSAGFRRIAVDRYFAAYLRCPPQ